MLLQTLAGALALAAVLIARWLIRDADGWADQRAGRLLDPCRETPEPDAPELILWRVWQGGELLVYSTSRPSRRHHGALLDRTYPITLTRAGTHPAGLDPRRN